MMLHDDAIRAMLTDRAARADASGLREAAIAAARVTPQLRPLARPPLARPALRVAAWLAGLAAVLFILALVVVSPRSSPQGPLGGLGTGSASPVASPVASPSASLFPSPATPSPATPSPSTPSPSPTRVVAFPPTYVRGTCPVTPATDLVGGTTFEVAVGGVRWNWGGIPWQAGVGQKVIVLPVTGSTFGTEEILAERLPIGSPGSPLSVVYPNGGNDHVYGVGLPEPGCWLLTLIGPDERSSVVVQAAAAPPNPPDPSSENVPTATAPLQAPSVCPVSPQWPSANVRSWLDGDLRRWQDPDPSPWLPGRERKLVVDGTGGEQPLERVVATRVGTVGRAGTVPLPAFLGSVPTIATPVPGGGSKAMGLTLPTAGCWAITYLDPTTTSTIVIQIGP